MEAILGIGLGIAFLSACVLVVTKIMEKSEVVARQNEGIRPMTPEEASDYRRQVAQREREEEILRQKAAEAQKKADEEAAERAFWASPEGQKVRAAEMIAEIRLSEQAEALRMARQVAYEEEARKEREFARLKEL
jgi:hypothetical protein